MDTKDILLQLRTRKGLSQEQLAEQVFVTRQAVSRWETGETTPNTDTLKLLSRLYDVSINTSLSREPDGTFNEDYCKWCYTDGAFTYTSQEQLIAFCAEHMASDAFPKEQVRAHMQALLPQLKHWKK